MDFGWRHNNIAIFAISRTVYCGGYFISREGEVGSCGVKGENVDRVEYDL